MEQQNLQFSKKPVESPRRRFLRLWGPLLIKMGISYLIGCIFVGIIMTIYLTAEVGTDPELLRAIKENEEQLVALYNITLERYIEYTAVVEGIAAVITIPIMLLLYHRDKVQDRIRGIVWQKKAPLWKYSAIIVMSAALCVGINNIFLLSNLAEYSAGYEKTMEALYNPGLFVEILCLGLLVPICEEMVFRGLMYRRLRREAGFVLSMIYTTIVFGLVHINMVQMIYATCMALVFCYVYEKYGSVKAPILAHVTANITSILATEYQLFEWMLKDAKRLGMITVGCAAIASTMYVLIARIENEPEIPENIEGKTEEY